MKKQGKRSKKKHLSKEAFRKIRYKQNMWRVYKHTGKDTDYDAYKEALNAVAYPGGFSGCPETPPPAMIFFLIRGFTSLHAPTFTSHLNLRHLETPLETNSGYATEMQQQTKLESLSKILSTN